MVISIFIPIFFLPLPRMSLPEPCHGQNCWDDSPARRPNFVRWERVPLYLPTHDYSNDWFLVRGLSVPVDYLASKLIFIRALAIFRLHTQCRVIFFSFLFLVGSVLSCFFWSRAHLPGLESPVYTCDYAIMGTTPAPAYPTRVLVRVTLRQNRAWLAWIGKRDVFE